MVLQLQKKTAGAFAGAFDNSSPQVEIKPPRAEQLRVWLLSIGVLISLFLSIMDAMIVAPSLHAIATDFGLFVSVNWVALAYTLAECSCGIVFARVSDIVGRRNAHVAANAIFLISSIACAVSKNAIQLMICRAVQGIGGSGLYSLSMVITQEVCPMYLLEYAVSICGAVIALSTVVGPVIGGVLTEYATWRWIFWINCPLCVVSAFLVVGFWPPEHAARLTARLSWKCFDYAGAALLITSSILTVFPFQNAGESYTSVWNRYIFIAPLGTGVVSWLALCAWEFVIQRKSTAIVPVLPLSVFRNRFYASGVMVTLKLGFTVFMLTFLVPLRGQIVSGKSAVEAGIMLLPMAVTVAIGCAVAGACNSKTNYLFETMLIGTCFSTVGCALLTTVSDSSDDSKLLGYLALTGFGCGLAITVSTIMVAVKIRSQDAAPGQGIVAQARILGGSLSISVSSIFLQREVGHLFGGSDSAQFTATPLLGDQITTLPNQLQAAVRHNVSKAFQHCVTVSAVISGAAILVSLIGYNTTHDNIKQEIRDLRSQDAPITQQRPARRRSLNSLELGSMASLVAIKSSTAEDDKMLLITPFVFSASSKQNLLEKLASCQEYLERNPGTNPIDLAWTLHRHQPQLQFRIALPATSISALCSNLARIAVNPMLDLRPAAARNGGGRMLGVFSGQGAQWARMGAEIIEKSAFAADILVSLDYALSQLPEEDRPHWKLRDELLASASLSNVKAAAFAPVLSTAVQIILVDLLYLSGIRFAAVVGHSSGEIAAAYAAGRLSASDAIGIAYYCGLYSHLASGIGGAAGAMLAVHMSFQDGKLLCNTDSFKGRISIAACNSPSSITFSGDERSIAELETSLMRSQRFSKRLPVDKAYHSHHMLPCTQRYLQSLRFLSGKGKWVDTTSDWVSSVYPDRPLTEMANVDGRYWVENILSTVLFSQAVQRALRLDPFDAVIEVGPHTVLKGHVRDTTLQSVNVALPYTGLLQRNKDANQTFTGALGYVWARVANLNIDFERYERAVTGLRSYRSISDLPVCWADEQALTSHALLYEESQTNTPPSREMSKGIGPTQPVAHVARQRTLSTAVVQDPARESIREAVLAELRNQLCETDHQMIETLADTDDLGLDSLGAVQLSSWLRNNYQVNIDVISILAGISVNDIIEKALSTSVSKNHNSSAHSLQYDIRENLATRRNSDTSARLSNMTRRTTVETTNSPMRGVGHNPQSIETAPSQQGNFTKVGKLSHSQSSFMFSDSLLEDKGCQTIAFMLRLKGDIRVSQLKEAIYSVGQLHESLRTCVRMHDGQLVQGVLPLSCLTLQHKELRNQDELYNEYETIRRYNFDLTCGKTIAMSLVSLSPQEHYILVGCHHILFDRSSFDALKVNLEQAYNGHPRLQVQQYLDYSNELHRQYSIGAWDTAIAYWCELLSPAPLPLPLHRSLVLNRRPTGSHKFHETTFQFSPCIAANVQRVAKLYGSTPFHFYLAAFKVLLHRFLGIGDVCINIVDNCRRTDYLQTGIGPFINILPIRMSAESSERFCDAIIQARQKVLLSLGNSIPLEVIAHELRLEHNSTHPTFSQVLVNYVENTVADDSLFLGCQVDIIRYDESELPYDMSCTIVNNKAAGDVSVLLRVQGALYSEESARLIAYGYEDVVKDGLSSPTNPVGSAWRFRPSTLDEALTIGRGPSITSDWPATLPHRFDNLLSAVSNRIAAEDNNGLSMTYADLSRRIQCAAFELSSKGVVTGSRVCVFQYPTVLWVVSVMAILKVGAIYVPLDPSTPVARLSIIVGDCEPRAILVHNATAQLLEEFHSIGNATVIDISSLCEACPKPNTFTTLAQANSPAVILYTSGSSGTPKGVVLRHESLIYEIELCVSTYGVKHTDIVLQQSAWSFDLSVTQLFLAVAVGAKLYVASHHMRADPRAMVEIIKSKGVTITYATPTEYKSWLGHHPGPLRESGWRLGLLGGEPVTKPLLQRFRELDKPDLRLFNTYAPTETTCTSARTELIYAPDDEMYRNGIPVGKPSANESIYILDEVQNLLPCGQVGEVVIGGVGVAVGYLNSVQNSSPFLSNPFADDEYLKMGWKFMYRTGDIGYLRKDGALILKGRVHGDTEVKLNGIRINLIEVEQTILQAARGTLTDAIASLRSFSDDTTKHIVAHVQFSCQSLLMDKHQFIQSLAKDLPLPSAMRPSAIIPIENFPRTTSGKVDRKAIADLPIPKRSQLCEDSRLLSDTEIAVKRLWKAVIPQALLELHHIKADSDFFAVGGNSLALIELQSEIDRQFNARIPLLQLFQSSTLHFMAQLLEGEGLNGRKHLDWAAETRLQPELHLLSALQQASSPAKKAS